MKTIDPKAIPAVLVVGLTSQQVRHALCAADHSLTIVTDTACSVDDMGREIARRVAEGGLPVIATSASAYSYFGATAEVLQAGENFAEAIMKTVQTGPIATVGSESLASFVERLGANGVTVVGKGTDNTPPSSS